jgi:hypothetical protein
MEAWMKFNAPGITVPLGLGIGKIVFSALNKVEWILCILISTSIFFGNKTFEKTFYLPLAIPLAILLAQTIWLLPALNQRAELVILGQTPPPSQLHFLFIIFEIIKCTFLIISGIISLKNPDYERIRNN